LLTDLRVAVAIGRSVFAETVRDDIRKPRVSCDLLGPRLNGVLVPVGARVQGIDQCGQCPRTRRRRSSSRRLWDVYALRPRNSNLTLDPASPIGCVRFALRDQIPFPRTEYSPRRRSRPRPHFFSASQRCALTRRSPFSHILPRAAPARTTFLAIAGR